MVHYKLDIKTMELENYSAQSLILNMEIFRARLKTIPVGTLTEERKN